MPAAARIVLTANGHAEVFLRRVRHRHRDLYDHGAGRGRYARLPIENITIKLGDSTLPQAPVEGGSWMAATTSHAIVATAEEIRKELLNMAKAMNDSALAAQTLKRHAHRRQARQQAGPKPRRLDRGRDAARRHRSNREGKDQQFSRGLFARAQHAFGLCLPR